MRNVTITGLIFCVVFIFSCTEHLNPSNPDEGTLGEMNASVVVSKVGAISRSETVLEISLAKLYITLTAKGEKAINDTIAISGNEQVTIQKTYNKLKSGVTWTLAAKTLDQNNKMIHTGQTTFTLQPCESKSVSLILTAGYSMLAANFFPIRDSVNRCEISINAKPVASATFKKQSIVGDTVKLSYDYLTATPAGVKTYVKLDVYGDMWGQNMLLYTGDTNIVVKSGEDKSYNVVLDWIGPNQPQIGQLKMVVVLGAIGTTTINGILDDPGQIIADCDLFEKDIACIDKDTNQFIGLPVVPDCDCANMVYNTYIFDLCKNIIDMDVTFELKLDITNVINPTGTLEYSSDSKSWTKIWNKTLPNDKEMYAEKVFVKDKFRYIRASTKGINLKDVTVFLKKPGLDCSE